MQLTQRFSDALVYATTLHQQQMRKVSDSPYVAHLLRVAGIVLEYGATEDEAIAALLHDAIEDQGGSEARDEIGRRFGPTVVSIVEGCTDASGSPKPPWKQRKDDHVAHVREADSSVRLVVTADKIDNARSLIQEYRRRGEAIWEFFHGGREGTLWYYHAMLDALKASGTNPLIDEYERTLAELDQLVGTT